MTGVALARGFSKGSLDKNPLLRQWIGFDVPGMVTLYVGKVEFGQGIATALAQIAAEELDVSLARIHPAAVTTADSPDEGVTSGSLSVQHAGAAVRLVCATLREMALMSFCARHGVDAATVRITDGILGSTDSEAQASYWDLQLKGLMAQGISPTAVPKLHTQYKTVGQAAQRRDLPAKLFGKASFIQDMQLSNMLHGRVVRVPNRLATLLTVDAAGFRQRFPDVVYVRDGSFLGVLADREEQAVAAADQLAQLAVWDLPAALPDSADLEGFLRNARSHRAVVEEKSGAPAAAPAINLQASYGRPFIAHASIGPSCALAHWQSGKLDVWSHSQGIFNLKTDIEVYLGRDHPEMQDATVVVHHVEGAGCYGHNPADDVAFDAVLLARFAAGRPVRVLWSRADELSCGPCGPAHLVALDADIGSDGRVSRWSHTLWANGYTARPGRSEPGKLSFLGAAQITNPFEAPVSLDPPMSVGGGSDRNAVPWYVFSALQVVKHQLLDMPIRTSAIRALGAHTNVWAIESFMDELAHAANQDPVAFRLAHLEDPRASAVIEKALSAAPWWNDKSGDREGTGRGMAFARYKNTGAWCAVAVHILAEQSIRVLDISIAADVGLAINPDGVANQLEGGAIQSCSWTLKEELRFTHDQITTRSWADYPILSFSEAPVVRVSLIDRPDAPPLGAGEAAQGPTAAAIGNAVFDALGLRVRQLPITAERILAATSSS